MSNKQLFIAVDPGFDSMKVVANGIVFKFPFNVVETDERKMSDYALRNDFLLYKSPLGTTYRVGQYAREMLFENKRSSEDGMQNFYTEQRFISDSFSVGLNVAIALSIVKAGLYLQQDTLDIHLIVALPHACRNQFASTIIGKASGLHEFNQKFFSFADLQVGFLSFSEAVKVHMALQTAHVVVHPSVLAVFLVNLGIQRVTDGFLQHQLVGVILVMVFLNQMLLNGFQIFRRQQLAGTLGQRLDVF